MRPHLRVVSRPPAHPSEMVGEAVALMVKLRAVLNNPGFPAPREMVEALCARSAGDEQRLRALLAVGGDDGPRAA